MSRYGNYANYSFVVDDGNFNPFNSMQEMLVPFQAYKDAYDKTEAAYDELETKASIWEGMANEMADPIAYGRYKKYADDLRAQADDLARNGYTMGNRRALHDLRRRYGAEIQPIEEAYKTRKAQIDEQRAAMLKDPTLLLSRRADLTSLDDYLKNPQLSYETVSGAMLAQQVGTAASAIGKGLSDYIQTGKLDDYTKTWIEKRGYSVDEVAKAIANPDSSASSMILNKLVDDVVSSSRVPSWANNETKAQAYNIAKLGLWNAVGQSQIHTFEDYGKRLEAKTQAELAEAQMKAQIAASAAKEQAANSVAINPVNIYSTKERSAAKKEMDEFSKFFTVDSNGNPRMTAEGLREYNRKVVNTQVGLTGYGQSSSKDTPFKEFIDKLGGASYAAKKQVGNLGNLWAKFKKENEKSNYDMTKTTEFESQAGDKRQKEIKTAILIANRGSDHLEEVDFDRATNTFKPTGEKLDTSDFSDDKTKVLSTTYSVYGSTVIVQDKDGNIRRLKMPKEINPTNEYNRDEALRMAEKWKNIIVSGEYIDDKGVKHKATPENLAKAQQMYEALLQQAAMFHSQLGLSDETKEQEFHPYGF